MPTLRNPFSTVNIIIDVESGGVILACRKNPPLGQAVQGGFVDYVESLDTAAAHEALEETTLRAQPVKLFHIYSDPNRDPPAHHVYGVYCKRERYPARRG